MAGRTIDPELNKIKSAIYGEEVRDSIHDAIAKIYDIGDDVKDTVEEYISDFDGMKVYNQVPNNTDLNTYITNGIWELVPSYTYDHSPVSADTGSYKYGFLFVIKPSAGSRLYQLIFSFPYMPGSSTKSVTSIYFRFSSNSTFTNWRSLYEVNASGVQYLENAVNITAFENGHYATADGRPAPDTGTSSYKRNLYPIRVKPNVGVYIGTTGLSGNVHVLAYDTRQNFISAQTIKNVVDIDLPCVLPSNAAYINVNYNNTNSDAPSSLMLRFSDGSKITYVDNRAVGPNDEIIKVIDGYSIKQDGTLTENTGYKAVFIANPKFSKMYSSSYPSNVMLCYDTNKEVITPTIKTNVTEAEGNPNSAYCTLKSGTSFIGVNVKVTNSPGSGYFSFHYDEAKNNSENHNDYLYGKPLSRLNGKHILCIGDSITYMDGRNFTNNDNSTDYVVGWQKYLKALGAYTYTYAYSGCPYAVDPNDSSHPSIANKIVDDVQPNYADYDIVVLFGGANDQRLGLTLKNNSKNNSYTNRDINPATTVGAIGKLINAIRVGNPMAEIFLCTVLPSDSGNESIPGRNYTNGVAITEAIIECGRFWSVPVIDLFSTVNITPHLNHTEMYEDNIHPNNVGQNRVGRIIASHIENYMSAIG